MLIGNYSVLNKNPGRAFGGSTVSDTRAQCNKSGPARGIFANDTTSKYSAIPNGALPPTAWLLPQKSGGMASKTGVKGEGEVASSNLAGGLNGSADFSGSGAITNAGILYVIVAAASLYGAATSNADISGKLEGAAALLGSGDLQGAIGGLINAAADLAASGTMSDAGLSGALNAAATLLASGDIAGAITGVIGASATLSGSASLSSSILGLWEMVCALNGSSATAANLQAIANMVATITAEGEAAGAIRADASISSAITAQGDALSASTLAAAVWSAVAAEYNASGTMGEKINTLAGGGVSAQTLRDAMTLAATLAPQAGSLDAMIEAIQGADFDTLKHSLVRVKQAAQDAADLSV